jgi:type I restriction enzyme S subunit
MELKPGYKQTEAGVIPEDWDMQPLEKLSSKIMVGIASAATHAYRSAGVPMFRNQNIKEGWLDDSDLRFLDSGFDELFRGKRLLGGDLLTARTGYPGTTAVVPSEYSGAQSFTSLITRPDASIIDSDYLCLYINSPAGKAFFEQSQIGGAQKNVNASSLKKMPVAFPKAKEEQKSIADAVATVDAFISSLENLISKKRAIKQAAMQQLLSGKRRMLGLEKEWEVKRLGDIGTFFKGSGVTRDQSQGGQLGCIRYGELYTDHDSIIQKIYSWIPPAVAEAAFELKSGDILFAGSGETKEEIGKCAAFVSESEAYAGGDIIILRPKGCDSRFLGYFLNSYSIARQKASRGQGDAVVHISSSALSGIAIKIPDRQEQTIIADVLVEIDTEIDMLEQRLCKTRSLKQAMIQELLTGRIRLA